MRNLFWFFLFTCTWQVASAQRACFIYLQSENGSAFYVKMGDKIMSSSAQGYLIIPSLADSTHNLSLGFPSSGSEMKFRIAVNGKDKGFLIKNFDFGWGLYDLQQESIIKPLVDEGRRGSYRIRNDDFSILLSRAAKDSSLLLVPIAAKEEIAVKEPSPAKKPVVPVEEKREEPTRDTVTSETVIVHVHKGDTVIASGLEPIKDTLAASPPILNVDSMAIVQDKKEPPVDEKKVDEVQIITAPVENKKEEQPESYKKSMVRKYSESSTSEGFGLVYFDETQAGIDTIRLLIPNPPVMLRQDDTVQQDQRFLDISEVNANKKIDKVEKQEEKKLVATSTCKEIAGKSDFMKLRRNMAAESTDEAMVDEAKKYFRSRCFTTEQVKNLGALFLSSAGKYLFYDAAYFHVTDRENFPSLASEIKDDYYLKRFKALIGE